MNFSKIKKRALIKSLKSSLIAVCVLFVVIFFYTWICGRTGDELRGVPYKCQKIPFKDAVKMAPFVLFFSVEVAFFTLVCIYPYKLENEKRISKLEESEEEKNANDSM